MFKNKLIPTCAGIILTTFIATGCAEPTPGPDKAAAGTVLGAGWGSGAGAVIGNQIGNVGAGIGVGAGFGAAQGLIVGAGGDLLEAQVIEQKEQLAALQLKNAENGQQLASLQAQFDRARSEGVLSGVYQVFFDSDATNLRSGSISNLEVIADQVRATPGRLTVNVVGHSDDSGTPEYNRRMAEARARAVASYLGARGLSMSQIDVSSYGSERPISSNSTPEGRQLNRRVDVFVTGN